MNPAKRLISKFRRHKTSNINGTSKKRCKLNADNILLLATIAGVVAGIALGIGLKYGLKDRDPVMTPREIGYLKLPGELFLRCLKMLILPLIFSSLVNSLANLDAGTAGRLGFIAMCYYLITIVMAVFTGIVLVLAIKPGSYGTIPNNVPETGQSCKGLLAIDTVLDLLR